jgi:hypothetical protein
VILASRVLTGQDPHRRVVPTSMIPGMFHHFPIIKSPTNHPLSLDDSSET